MRLTEKCQRYNGYVNVTSWIDSILWIHEIGRQIILEFKLMLRRFLSTRRMLRGDGG